MGSRKNIPKNQRLYSRPTKAYQQQMTKRMPELQPPEMPDAKKSRIVNIAIMVVCVAAAILLSIFVSPWLAFIPLLAAVGYGIYFIRSMNMKQFELLGYYMAMGMNKKTFFKQMERHGLTEKNRAMYNKMWDVTAQKEGVKLTWLDKLSGYNKAPEMAAKQANKQNRLKIK